MSSKLRPAGDVARSFLGDYFGQHDPDVETLTRFIQADRDAHGEAIAELVEDSFPNKRLLAAIHAVAKPPEDMRARLGRAMRHADKHRGILDWHVVDDDVREHYCNMADAVLAEQAKISKEEADE